MINLKYLRREYTSLALNAKDLNSNPFKQFDQWLQEAHKAQILEPNAMILATATQDGKPSSRTVLLKKFDQQGLVFFTNEKSRKAREIEDNPQGSVTFLWLAMARQVNIEGKIEKIPFEETQAYFATRPRGSQLGAWASHQGEVIASRQALESAYKKADKHYQQQVIPAPPYWAGYRITPKRFEFWQGRENRLHDRFEYCFEHLQWHIQRLSP
jgi:pyridoxamine 5'-phosphate oxidase